MKNIITAMGNPYLNDKLRQNTKEQVLLKDIQYQEGVLEVLQEIEDIDIVLVSSSLLGEMSFNKFIQEILSKKDSMEIVIFIEKNEVVNIPFLNSKGIYKVYENTIEGYQEFLSTVQFNNSNVAEQVKLDSKQLKQMILQKQKGNSWENPISIKSKGKIFLIAGNAGVGKSLFTILLAKKLETFSQKVLLLDTNQDLQTILGSFSNEKNTDDILQVSKWIEYQCISNEQIRLWEQYANLYFYQVLEKWKKQYDCIVMDMHFFEKYVHFVDEIIFLIEPNIMEIKKAKQILETYEKDWEIPYTKVQIIFNKVNSYHIDFSILKEIFKPYTIIGYIPYNPEYTLYINQNAKRMRETKELKEIFKKIIIERK